MLSCCTRLLLCCLWDWVVVPSARDESDRYEPRRAESDAVSFIKRLDGRPAPGDKATDVTHDWNNTSQEKREGLKVRRKCCLRQICDEPLQGGSDHSGAFCGF